MFQHRTTPFMLKKFGGGRLPVQSSDLKYVQFKVFVENRSLFITCFWFVPSLHCFLARVLVRVVNLSKPQFHHLWYW